MPTTKLACPSHQCPIAIFSDVASVELALEGERITQGHVDELLDGSEAQRALTENSDVLETIRMFAHDKGWMNRLREAIDTGLTAEAAVERVQNDTRARMMRSTDPYIKDRLHDLDDLARAGWDLVDARDDVTQRHSERVADLGTQRRHLAAQAGHVLGQVGTGTAAETSATRSR